MRVTILPGDKAVYVDGKALEIANWDDLGIDPAVESVEYDSALGRGVVQYKRPDPVILDKAKFDDLFVHAVAHFDNRVYDLEKERVEFEARTKANDEKIRQATESRRKANERTSAEVAALKAKMAALQDMVAKLSAQVKTQ
jgi:hypothetical protein